MAMLFLFSSLNRKFGYMQKIIVTPLLIAYASCIPLANWMIGHVGICHPDGPCVLLVAPNIYAPSGVTMIGVALVLRDMVQRMAGMTAALLAVVGGTLFSALVAPPSLVLASSAAFLASELLDMAVYTPLARRNLGLALLASGIAGGILDSALFLLLAFGSLDYIVGQIIGKAWGTIASAIAIIPIRNLKRA